MINVIATIRLKEGRRDEFLEIFKSNVPAVLDEQGCVEYFPAVDLKTGLAPQVIDDSAVTVVEKWESVDALKNHLKAPHMAAYQSKVKDMVIDVSIMVLQEA